MRKNVIVALSIVMAVFFSSPAYSADGPYVSVNLGMAKASDSDVTDSSLPGEAIDMEYDAGFVLGAALGYHFGSIGFEGEVAYQKTDLDKISLLGSTSSLGGDGSALSFLVNGYYAFVFGKMPLRPYLSAGFGLAQLSINNLSIPGSSQLDWSDDDFVFAYQVGAGLEFDLGNKFSIGAKYRFFGTSDPEFKTTDTDFASHNVMLVIKRSF